MMLEPMTRELIVDTQRLHTRVARLDMAWQAENASEGSARIAPARATGTGGRKALTRRQAADNAFLPTSQTRLPDVDRHVRFEYRQHLPRMAFAAPARSG